jgi:hypothetical protein
MSLRHLSVTAVVRYTSPGMTQHPAPLRCACHPPLPTAYQCCEKGQCCSEPSQTSLECSQYACPCVTLTTSVCFASAIRVANSPGHL